MGSTLQGLAPLYSNCTSHRRPCATGIGVRVLASRSIRSAAWPRRNYDAPKATCSVPPQGSTPLASGITTRFLAPAEHPRWAALVEQSADGSAYSLPAYLDALCAATGGSYRILVAERDHDIVGGIALYEERGRFGRIISPRLLLYCNGLVRKPHPTKTPGQENAWHVQTLTAIEQALHAIDAARLRVKSRASVNDLRMFRERWQVQPTYTYVVALDDMAAAWARVDKNLRRLVSRCEAHGLTLAVDGDFDAFHRLHEATHRRKGAPLYLEREPFRHFYETLRGHGLAHLYHALAPDGRVAASQLVLTGHPVTHTVAAATDADFLNLGATAFLRWKTFEHLAQAGHLANDLTDAALNPVSAFKAQLGGELQVNLEFWRRDGLALRAWEQFRRSGAAVKRRLRSGLRQGASE